MSGSNLFTGTLDILILKTLKNAALHGYGIGRWIRENSNGVLDVEEGALYPALRRLEKKKLVEASWGPTQTGREAKFYALTEAGERHLEHGLNHWGRYVEAMSLVLHATDGSP